jgi:transcriptional regulator with XRE-family HTH domain
MNIAQWREKRGLKLSAAAGLLGLSEATLSRYETGSRRPDLKTIQEIAAKTEGEVQFSDWLSDDPPRAPRRRSHIPDCPQEAAE